MGKEFKEGIGSIYKNDNGTKIGEAYYEITVVAPDMEGIEDTYGYLTDINAEGFNEDDEFVLHLTDGSTIRFKAVGYDPTEKTCGMTPSGDLNSLSFDPL